MKTAPMLNLDLTQTQADFSMELEVMPQDQQGLDLLTEMTKYPFKIDRQLMRARAHSADLTYINTELKLNQFSRLKLLGERYVTQIWDNSFFDRLFPRIKQQKPGTDLYTWLASISVFIIFYIIIFMGGMQGEYDTVSEQFSGNAISGTMVLSMMSMMILMVIDRYFYAQAKEMQRKATDERLGTDKLISDD